ncbi:MAG: ribosome silencing factor [Lachnospiraceae bacterium]|nr:ribosome silencing factor [Lachnospiraceae bacterium]
MTSQEMAKIAHLAIEDKKAEDIKIIDISKVSVIADYFIIASGNNRNQVQALADNVQEELGKRGVDCKQIEGYQTANWILLDYNDIIVHIFNAEDRLFYDLERIWRDGKSVEVSEL